MDEVERFEEALLRQPFGSLTKRELELLILNLLIDSDQELKTNVGKLSRKLKISISRTNSYLTDIAHREEYLKDSEAVKRLISILRDAEVSKDESSLLFSVHDARLRIWIQNTLVDRRLLLGETFRVDLIKLSGKAIAGLIEPDVEFPSVRSALPLLREKFHEKKWLKELEDDNKNSMNLLDLVPKVDNAGTLIRWIIQCCISDAF